MSTIEETLAERVARYGTFAEHARITQAMKRAMETGRRWPELAPDQREALEVIAHKIARILNGDPNYHDSWHDIVGYARLVADRLAAQPELKTLLGTHGAMTITTDGKLGLTKTPDDGLRIVPRPEFYDVDVAQRLPIGTTAELWRQFEERASLGIDEFARRRTLEGPAYVCGGYVAEKQMVDVLRAAAAERHGAADSNARGDDERITVHVGEDESGEPRRRLIHRGDLDAFVEIRDGTGLVPKGVITLGLWQILSPRAQTCFVRLTTHAIADRSCWGSARLDLATRHPQTLSSSDHSGRPLWAKEMYEPRDGVEGEWQLRPHLRERWGR